MRWISSARGWASAVRHPRPGPLEGARGAARDPGPRRHGRRCDQDRTSRSTATTRATGDPRSWERTPRTTSPSTGTSARSRWISRPRRESKQPDGSRAGSDVLIENFRPGLMAELGLAPEELRGSTPGLITCSLTAFNDDVADAGRRPGYDIMVQALSGLMSVTGEPGGEPVKAGVALLDVITGLQAAIGILAALHERTRTGRGRHVSVSLFDASAAAMVNQAANHLIGGIVCRTDGDGAPQHLSLPGVPRIRPALHPRCGQRQALPENVRGGRTPRVGRGPALPDEPGSRAPPRRAHPAPRRHPSRPRARTSGSRRSRPLPFRAPRSGRWTRCSRRPKAPRSSSR